MDKQALASIGHNGGPPLDLKLDPDAIIPREEGPKYFGLKRSRLDEGIKSGVIPRPFPLTEGGRKTGWLGQQIIDHHRRRIAAPQDHSSLANARAEQKRQRASSP
jgi:predicted DNA-binding transcriptional regulator AlpA